MEVLFNIFIYLLLISCFLLVHCCTDRGSLLSVLPVFVGQHAILTLDYRYKLIQTTRPMYHLNQDEIDSCRKSFEEFDADRSGTIDEDELAEILSAMGYNLTSEEIFRLISENCDAIVGQVIFGEFLHLIAKLKDQSALIEDQSDMAGCFVACGGKMDGSGFIDKDELVRLIKTEFALPIDVEAIMRKLDKNADGEIDFTELKALLH